MTCQSLQKLQIFSVPDLNRFVLTRGGNELIIWRELSHINELLMCHHSEHGLVDSLNFIVILIRLNNLLDVPDLNGVVLTRTHELLSLLWGEVDATDVLIMSFEDSDTFDLLEWVGRRVIPPKSDVLVFGS